ncbi:MAG: tyrosine--tRNA ligase, partial [Saprospiraceae bacterium]|nr:tyrosine--tRNA ligase [Saprospiraceae bacterium]
HTPIVLMGGATGRIGDPSFKEKERELKSYDELDSNLTFQKEQIKKFLDFEGPNAAIIVNNHDFYNNMNVLDFLRDVGKTLTVSYMMSKDSVKNRLETGLSFTEFSYQLLQSYDFQVLFTKYHCILQMGGSDQWGNITSGTEFIRRNTDGKAYAVTTPLLTKADGTKFGKSEQGNIWLDPKLTSAYKFYQFWLNSDDADLPKYLRYFTLKTKEEVETLEKQYRDDPRGLKAILAEELTRRVHSDEDFEIVKESTEKSRGNIFALTEDEFKEIITSIPTVKIQPIDIIEGEWGIYSNDNIFLTSIMDIFGFKSKSDLRRAVNENSLTINKVKITNIGHKILKSDLLHDKFLFVEYGKKLKLILDLSNCQFIES